ncbi:MAG: helix-turn-helix domain-containing protein [Azonexaceae bacterium]|nr:helix-turn-helix domain-containing protein [Azonexaceae bacterium]
MPKTTTPPAPTPLVNEFVAAQILGISVSTLRKDRNDKKRFPFVRYGLNGTIRYDINQLNDYLRANLNGGVK